MAKILDFPKQKVSLQEKPRVWPCPPPPPEARGVVGMCGAWQLDFQVLRSGPTWARHLGCHGRWSRPTCPRSAFPQVERPAKQCWFGCLRSSAARHPGRPETGWPRAPGRASRQERRSGLRSLGRLLQFHENMASQPGPKQHPGFWGSVWFTSPFSECQGRWP